MKKIYCLLIIFIFIFCLLCSLNTTARYDKELKIENSLITKELVNSAIRKNTHRQARQLIQESINQPKPKPKPELELFSNIIKVKTTKEIKEKINKQLQEYQIEIQMLAKVVYREARGIKSDAHKAGVIWCVLNRVDNETFDDSISKVITAKHQFAWVPKTPIKEEFCELAKDVIARWLLEKEGYTDVGRVLPNDYLFFAGRNGLNYFRKNYHSRTYWDWSLQSPYENDNFVGGINGPRLTNGICPRTYSKSTTPR